MLNCGRVGGSVQVVTQRLTTRAEILAMDIEDLKLMSWPTAMTSVTHGTQSVDVPTSGLALSSWLS